MADYYYLVIWKIYFFKSMGEFLAHFRNFSCAIFYISTQFWQSFSHFLEFKQKLFIAGNVWKLPSFSAWRALKAWGDIASQVKQFFSGD